MHTFSRMGKSASTFRLQSVNQQWPQLLKSHTRNPAFSSTLSLFQQLPMRIKRMRTCTNSIEVQSRISTDLDKFCVSSMMKLSNSLLHPL